VEGSDRELAYSRLHVSDATGRELPARIDVVDPGRLEVRVDDHRAAYPVRIDPTFSDADWLSMGDEVPGTGGEVSALVVDGTGNLYVGGRFTVAGKVVANGIAKWDGSAWSALGSGMSNAPGLSTLVYALALDGSGNLYAGGFFSNAGGVSAKNIAKWNGSTWGALGSGMNNSVSALLVSGTDLYAGGDFTTAGGVSVNKIAKWNGSGWSALGSGVSGSYSSVRALAGSGTNVYVGGSFTTAGAVSANRVAKWDGNAWSALGSGVSGSNNDVSALAVSGTDLYVGGDFSTAGGVSTNRIAKWNGSTWSALGSGMNGSVSALALSGTSLYAGGNFTTAGGVSAKRIAKWNGSAWASLGSGMDSIVGALAVSGSDLYAGGYFTDAGGVGANFVAKWNGSTWNAMGSGTNGTVQALAVSGTDLYLGGAFTTAGTVGANHVVKWNGSAWSALGSGTNGSVMDLVVDASGNLFAGGSFTMAGGASANNIAKWNGSAWSALGSGTNDSVYAMVASGTDLYAGGFFTTAGGVSANYIAKWNGSTWSALGSGMSGPVFALVVSGPDLYVGGSFTAAGGTSASRIAKWNGSNWSALGSGMSDTVFALVVRGTDLYAGGWFGTAGGVSANYIAKWNGSTWSALGSGLNYAVFALAVFGTDIYAGGDFTTAGGLSANYIAKWNGSAWGTLASGVGGFVYLNSGLRALAVDASGNLYTGGDFTTAGGKVSAYVAKARIAESGTGSVPSVTTPTSTNVTATTATLGGKVTSDGGVTITERGLVYSVIGTNGDPVVGGAGVTKIIAGGTTGVFAVPVTGLTAGAAYSFKAYATTSAGTGYTNVATFTTLSTNANLSALALNIGTLSPAFASAATSYTASVSNATTSITVTPSAAQANVTIQARVNGGPYSAVTSGNASAALSLNMGSNTVDVLVTAQDAATTKTYTVAVTRLAALTVIAATPTSITTMEARLGGNVTSDGSATVTERGVVYSVTATNSDPLIGGPGVTKMTTTGTTGSFTVPVTGLLAGTAYSFKVFATNNAGTSYTAVGTFRTLSSNADLNSLTLSAGTLEPAFASGTLDYAARVASETGSLIVTPTVAHPGASVKVNDIPVASGSASGAIPLIVGNTTITILVTAEDGTTKSYRLIVARPLESLTATYNAASDVPVTTSTYTATGRTVNFTLNCVPETGELMVIKNTGLDFIHGTFANLTHGQVVTLVHDGISYPFLANYYGGSGNDLVLVREGTRAFGWGKNDSGQVGDNSRTDRSAPVAVNSPAPGILFGKIVVSLVAGGSHSLALCSDGTVAAWGSNSNGELGNNGNANSLLPVAVNRQQSVSALFGKTVTALAAGGSHSLALCSDGTVAAWGFNYSGQLGAGTMPSSNVPVAVNTQEEVSALFGKKVVSIAAGSTYSLALCSDGTVVAWGANFSGQLGDNSMINRLVPVAVNTSSGVSALFGKSVVAVAAGSSHSLALCSDGTLVAWGSNFSGELGNNSPTSSLVPVLVNTSFGVSALFGKTVAAIAAGGSYSLALCSDRTVVAWGYNFNGQLGNDSTTSRSVPVTVSTVSGVSALFGKAVVAIAAGYSHSLALCSDGSVVAWGSNDGHLGNNTSAASSVPVAVSAASGISCLEGRSVVIISAGNFHSLALCSDGTVAAWGSNNSGQLGDTTTTSRLVPVSVNTPLAGVLSGKTVVDVVAGNAHCLAVCSDGTVAAWGRNFDGQLGDNSTATRLLPVGVNTTSGVSALFGKTVVAVAAGMNRSLALCSDGTLAAWGNGTSIPVAVNATPGSALDGKTVVAIAAGVSHSLALCSDGTVAAWGSNEYGQLGDNSTTSRLAPVAVNTASGVSALFGKTVMAIAAGAYHSLALCSDGTVAAWGSNLAGQLGAGTVATSDPWGRSVPVSVNVTEGSSALFGKAVVAIAAGNSHNLALCSDGNLVAWGDNSYGQLGNNSTTNSSLPVAVNSAAGISELFGKTIAAIAAGDSHSLVLCSDGSAAACGFNAQGGLGDGTTSTSAPWGQLVPVAVSRNALTASERFTHLASGSSAFHSLGLVALPVPPTVTTLAATGISNTRATLNGTVNANGFGSSVTFEYGTTTEYGSSVAGTPTPVNGTIATAVSAALTGLTPDTLYHYRVNGGFTHGEDMTFTTDQTSNNSDLASLAISEGALSPTFATEILNYSATTTPETDSLTVTSSLVHPRATVQVNGTSVASGSASGPLPLTIGSNIISILVTAEDGSTQSYRVTVTRPAAPQNLTFTYHATTDIPVTSSRYLATGKTINLALNCVPTPGDLMVVKNTGSNFIQGTFDNLAQGQSITLVFAETSYRFVANYYGGSGNDLVLVWSGTKAISWGANSAGQLGDNTKESRYSMIPVGYMMTNTGVLLGRTVTAVAAGGSHSLALCSDGTVVAWGANWNGQLGNNTMTESLLPVKVIATHDSSALFNKTVVAIAAGYQHSLALCSDGTVAAWGNNSSGQLGDGTATSSAPWGISLPVAVNTKEGASALFGKTVVAISAGYSHSLALCSDGTVVTWGNGTTAPIVVSATADSALHEKTVVSIAAGSSHSLALCSDGTVAAWGNGTTIPVAVSASADSALHGKRVVAISTGGGHRLAVCSDGTVAAWGSGILGDGTTTNSDVPVAVSTQEGSSALFGKSVVSITAGNSHSLALCSDGTMAAWGENHSGQLGEYGVLGRERPVQTGSWMSVTHVASGFNANHNLGLWADAMQNPAPACAPAAVTDLTQTSVRLNGMVNTQGWSSEVTFEYGTDGITFPNQVPVVESVTGSDVAVGAPVTGLTKGTTYYFRLEVASAGGRITSERMTFITRTEPTLVIDTAKALSAGVELTGSINAHGSDTQVFIDYGTDPAKLLFTVPMAPAIVTGYSTTAVSVVLGNLAQGTTYYYRLRGTSLGGEGLSETGSFQPAILSGLTQIFPGAPPAAQGVMLVTLSPPGIGGWRFVGEQQWRASGVPVGGLTTDNRAIEFRPVPGYIQPPQELLEVTSGGAATCYEGSYYETPTIGSGGLIVTLKPDSLAEPSLPVESRAQWRLLGQDDSHWRDSGASLANLTPGSYLIECKALAGRTTPPAASILLENGKTAAPIITYFLATASTGTQPSPVPFETVTNDATKPYAYVGQIRSDIGASSGFVVKPRVVATAGHVVFDDGTLTAVTGLQWLFQRHPGTYEPKPQIPRGFYSFTGYAAQRTEDNTPGSSSPAAQNLDAAALYFGKEQGDEGALPPDAGRGGYSGFLASDLDGNEFLLSSAQKMLVGYPVDGIAAANQGRMHATPPVNAIFAKAFGHTYTSPTIRSSGGASGGPLCVQFEGGNYYPAAIYLGGSGQTVVRSIDGQIVDLFNRAEISANGGANNTSGGVSITSITPLGLPSQPGQLMVTIVPEAARLAGAGWRLKPDTLYRNSGFIKSSLSPVSYILELTTVAGFLAPTQISIAIEGGKLKEITYRYIEIVPPPAITSANSVVAPRGQALSYQILATHAPTSYSITGSLPAGLGFDPNTGLISGIPEEAGVFTLTLGATNAFGIGTQVLAITCRPTMSEQYLTVRPGQPMNFQIVSSESGMGTSYSATNLPQGVVVNPESGTVSGSPWAPGVFPSLITVSKGGASASAILTLTVTATQLDVWRFDNFGTYENTGPAADSADPDGDGQTNLADYAAGTNPRNGADFFKILTAQMTGATFTVTASGKAGRSYALQYRSNAATGTWINVTHLGPLAVDGPVVLTDPAAPAENAFYRIQVSAP
jgi:alpha-tubulin suppressor-like RCC1 family protein